MKKIILIVVFSTTLFYDHNNTVYVCTGPKVKRYHLSENCRGLRNCQHKLIKLKLAEAEKSGKTLCGWEK